MNRSKYLFLAVVLGCLISPAFVTATPIGYTASGSVDDAQGLLLPISGEMTIDNQLRGWTTGQPTQLQGSGQYFYDMPGYSLTIGPYSFSGPRGELYMEFLQTDSPADDLDFGDFMWFLEDGDENSQWDSWGGEVFTFCNADGSPQLLPSQYGSLADIIRLEGLAYLPNYPDPIFGDFPSGFNLLLVRKNDSAPVPEPATMTLLGASALGMFLHRRRGSRQMTSALQAAPLTSRR